METYEERSWLEFVIDSFNRIGDFSKTSLDEENFQVVNIKLSHVTHRNSLTCMLYRLYQHPDKCLQKTPSQQSNEHTTNRDYAQVVMSEMML